MKKYLKMLPIMIYPYIYIICLVLYVFACSQFSGVDVQAYGSLALLAAAVICNLYCLFMIIANIVQACRGKYTARELTKMTMIFKLVQIPAFLFHFLMGAAGLLMSVWGIGFIMLAILMDVLSIFLTGMVGIGAAIACAKQKALSKGGAVIYAILNFIFCVDVVSSIIYFIVIRGRSKQQTPAGQTTN